MAQPVAYAPVTSFVTYQSTQPWFPGQKIDVELNNLKSTTDQVRANLALLQRDDGTLANGSVTYASLAPTLQTAGLAPLTAWAAGVAYSVPQVVAINAALYQCVTAHTSTAFATDLAARKWTLLTALPLGLTGATGSTGPTGNTGSTGAAGPTGPAAWTTVSAWLTSTAYTVGPAASVVTQGGETYVCLVSHTSGTFATDLAAEKWIKVAAKGADGAGTVSAGINHGVALFSAATSVGGVVAVGTAGRLLIDQGAGVDPAFQAVSGDATISSAGALTVTKTSGTTFGTNATKSEQYLNALDYGVKGDSSTNDASAINTLFTTAATRGVPVLFPGNRTYELGSSSLTVPAGVEVHCGPKAQFRRSAFGTYTSLQASTGAMISLGSYCRWTGGELNCSAYLSNSVTSNTIAGSGSKTWTIGTGLTLSINDQIRLENSAGKYMEGTVTAYNSGTGSVTITVAFSSGSGTYTAWNAMFMSLYLCPMIIRGATETHVSNVRTTGNWYVGPILDGSSAVSHCSIRSSYSESVRNRGFYVYGSVQRCTLHDLHVIGSSFTDYGINLNPATLGNIQDNTISQCYVDTTLFQAYEVGDNCFYNVFAGNVAANTNIGYLIQLANGNQPQFNLFSACVARACVTYGFANIGSLYNVVDGSSAVGCGTGFYDGPSGASNSQENSFTEILANANTSVGVTIAAGTVNSRISGRSVGNTTNLSDSGTGTMTGSLATT